MLWWNCSNLSEHIYSRTFHPCWCFWLYLIQKLVSGPSFVNCCFQGGVFFFFFTQSDTNPPVWKRRKGYKKGGQELNRIFMETVMQGHWGGRVNNKKHINDIKQRVHPTSSKRSELVERDAVALWWLWRHRRLSCRFVWRECDTFPDSELNKETSGDEKTTYIKRN